MEMKGNGKIENDFQDSSFSASYTMVSFSETGNTEEKADLGCEGKDG